MIPLIQKKIALTESEIREVLTAFPQAIMDALTKGKTVSIEKLGEFYPAEYVPLNRRKSSRKANTRALFRPDKELLNKLKKNPL